MKVRALSAMLPRHRTFCAIKSRAIKRYSFSQVTGETRSNYRQGSVAIIHSLVRASGSVLRVMSVTTAAISAPFSNTPGRRSGLRPPIATSGNSPISPLPPTDLFNALRRPFHFFQDRWIDRPQCDIIGLDRKSGFQFLTVMGRNAKFQLRLANGRDIGVSKVFLTKVDKVAVQFNRELPIVVHDKLAAVLLASVLGCCTSYVRLSIDRCTATYV